MKGLEDMSTTFSTMPLTFKAFELDRYYLDFFSAKALGFMHPKVELMMPEDRVMITGKQKGSRELVRMRWNPTADLDEAGVYIQKHWPQIREVLHRWHGPTFCKDATDRAESLMVWYLRALVASVFGDVFTDIVVY